MKAKIFLSYSEFDKKKLKALRNAMKIKDDLDPIVVSERRKVGQNLTDKVKQCMQEADCLMPILTRKSIRSQWVNQEIGFAEAVKIPIIPLVESCILDELKGFIHKQIDLPFVFNGIEADSKKEARNFRKCYVSALDYVAASSQISTIQHARLGKLMITKPTETYVSSEYVEVSGKNAKPGAAIIVITSLYGKHLAPQKGYAIADNLGNWKYDRCHLFNINKDRIVYAIAVDLVHEQRVRELLDEHRKPPRENAMYLFQQILKNEQIPFEISPGKKLVRRYGLVQMRRVRATMHKAYFRDTEPRVWAYFFKIVNLSKQDIEVTHVGIDYRGDYIEVHPPERRLPKRLKPDEEWETWIEFDKLPNCIRDNPFPYGRVRLSTGRIIKAKQAKNIPPKGEIAGGPVRPEYDKH